MMTLSRADVSNAVKTVLIRESRIRMNADALTEEEPLRGDRLNVNSMGFVGVLINLEDELAIDLPDDMFVGRTFSTVGDIVDIVSEAAGTGIES